MTTPSDRSPDEEALRRLAMEYLAMVEGDASFLHDPSAADILRDQLLALLGRAGDDGFDLLAWARDIAGGRRMGDEPAGDLVLGEVPRLRVGDHVGVLITHDLRDDGELYAVVQTGAQGYVTVPVEESREASEAEVVAAVRGRPADLFRYAELLGVGEATLRGICEEALAEYEPLRVLLGNWPAGPESGE